MRCTARCGWVCCWVRPVRRSRECLAALGGARRAEVGGMGPRSHSAILRVRANPDGVSDRRRRSEGPRCRRWLLTMSCEVIGLRRNAAPISRAGTSIFGSSHPRDQHHGQFEIGHLRMQRQLQPRHAAEMNVRQQAGRAEVSRRRPGTPRRSRTTRSDSRRRMQLPFEGLAHGGVVVDEGDGFSWWGHAQLSRFRARVIRPGSPARIAAICQLLVCICHGTAIAVASG